MQCIVESNHMSKGLFEQFGFVTQSEFDTCAGESQFGSRGYDRLWFMVRARRQGGKGIEKTLYDAEMESVSGELWKAMVLSLGW